MREEVGRSIGLSARKVQVRLFLLSNARAHALCQGLVPGSVAFLRVYFVSVDASAESKTESS